MACDLRERSWNREHRLMWGTVQGDPGRDSATLWGASEPANPWVDRTGETPHGRAGVKEADFCFEGPALSVL